MGAISHKVYLNCLHIRRFLGIFKDNKPREDFFVAFFFRIIDIWNEKSFRVRFDTRTAVMRLFSRIGFATYFPFVQPEQTTSDLDFNNNDERLAMSLWMTLASKEGEKNIREPFYIRADGVRDPLTLGVPRSWISMNGIPKGGS